MLPSEILPRCVLDNLCSNRTPEALRRNFISKAAKLFKFHLFNKISISHEGSNVSVWSLIYRSTGEIEPRDEKVMVSEMGQI